MKYFLCLTNFEPAILEFIPFAAGGRPADSATGRGRERAQALPRAGDIERLAREQLETAMLRLAISHYRGHIVRAGFLLLTRLMVPPRSGKHVLRTVRHEAFATAWQVMHLLAEVDGRYGSALVAWEQPVRQALEGRAPAIEGPKPGREGEARRRPRRGGRRHNRPKATGGA